MLTIPLIATLILAAPSTEGMVVCADRESYNPTTRTFDEAYRKLYPAGAGGVYAIAGANAFDGANHSQIFSASKSIEAFLATFTLPPKNDDDLGYAATQWLVNDYFKSGAWRIVRSGYETHSGTGMPVFQALFYYLIRGEPHVTRAQILDAQATGVDGPPTGKFEVWVLKGIGAAGADAVTKELQKGANPRFDDMRASPLVKALVQGTVTPPSLPSRRILEFERWLIRETSRRLPWIYPDKLIFVGSVADCAIVSERGVRWDLFGGKSPPPSRTIPANLTP
jgi:hypothetical protein